MNWNGGYKKHNHFSFKNFFNLILMLFIMTPSYIILKHTYNPQVCDMTKYKVLIWPQTFEKTYDLFKNATFLDKEALCEMSISYPVLMTNFLFFWNISVGFWIIGLMQKSMWLIDPYWQFVPVMIGWQYQYHPLNVATVDQYFGNVMMYAIYVWGVRLLLDYFSKQDFKFGQAEDWRYYNMAKQYGYWWIFVSFFAVGIAQQSMLVGLSLPFYSGFFPTQSFSNIDIFLFFACFFFVVLAHLSDSQLQTYMNKKRLGLIKDPILNSGLWYYSRHPNYFSEQSFWTCFWLFSAVEGHYWTTVGIVVNFLTFVQVIQLTEGRMLKGWTKDRVKLYEEYMRTTSRFFILPKFKKSGQQQIQENKKKK